MATKKTDTTVSIDKKVTTTSAAKRSTTTTKKTAATSKTTKDTAVSASTAKKKTSTKTADVKEEVKEEKKITLEELVEDYNKKKATDAKSFANLQEFTKKAVEYETALNASLENLAKHVVEIEDKFSKPTTLKDAIAADAAGSSPLETSKLSYKFFDPKNILPQEFKNEIPDVKTKFIISLNFICKAVQEKYEAVSRTGNSYVYAAFDKAVQAPTPEFNIVKEFLNDLIAKGKDVIIMVDDLDVKENQYKLTMKLVEENLVKFRLPYTDIVVNPELSLDQFEAVTKYSFITPIPVTDAFGNKAMFMAYSVDVLKA